MENPKVVDLVLFMGQSNMAGRGVAEMAPHVQSGMGYEYRAVTAPNCLTPLCEPFGKDENDPEGVYEPGMKTGSMVSAFVNACTARTGIPIVGVSCAKGGSSIAEWLPGTAYYIDAVRRTQRCRQYLHNRGCQIRQSYMLWCQGCTDGDLHTPPEIYKKFTERMLHNFMREVGLEICFLIQIGNHRDAPNLYVPIQNAQEELVKENKDIIMVSRQFKSFAARGLMKDQFHYLQPGYNLVGDEAGAMVGEYLLRHSH